MKISHFFAGGNTATGFFTCFDSILPVSRQKRMFYLKGGPGVGKSTFMRRVGQAAEQAGLDVEYYHCSSDPDSLDGVALPQRGVALMDGTAPHVYDPVTPGARDTLLSLGDFLDEPKLRSSATEIIGIQRDISARFARCYCYLRAAAAIRAAMTPGAVNPSKLNQLSEEWSALLPLRGGIGNKRRLFASAYTPKGLVDMRDMMGVERRFVVECPAGLSLTPLMSRLSQCATDRGLDCVELLDPLEPSQICGVLLPDHGVLFAQAQQEPNALPADRLFDLTPTREAEQSFDRNALELMTQRAMEQLTAAKALHDDLERPYSGSMDFLQWQTLLNRVLSSLF